jgi:regulator of sirC expression with transglutaminase-like and TPR domain
MLYYINARRQGAPLTLAAGVFNVSLADGIALYGVTYTCHYLAKVLVL